MFVAGVGFTTGARQTPSRSKALKISILACGLAMPVVVRTREYGSADSNKELASADEADIQKQAEKDIEELWE